MDKQPLIQTNASGQFREIVTDAIGYWERRRILYNVILATVVALWFMLTWPHFKPALTLQTLVFFFVLAMLANICYCAAYLADVPMQYSLFRTVWRRWRWGLWMVGVIFAVVIANYWIADEIYPYVR
ncbi:MAG TPA: hypothetical protein VGR97_14270 [Candidatus Acidoferrales bacterium]|nr:hypothetical protein [Candidatus Acidoferrales bacterium]